MPSQIKRRGLPLNFDLAAVEARLKADGVPAAVIKEIAQARAYLSKITATEPDYLKCIEIVRGLLQKGHPDAAIAILLSRELMLPPNNARAMKKYALELKSLESANKAVADALKFNAGKHQIVKLIDAGRPSLVIAKAIAKLKMDAGAASLNWLEREQLWALENMQPESDAAHLWNWRDPAWYVGFGLPYPFSQGLNTGVDLTEDQCDPADGWLLYVRRVLTSDGLKQAGQVAESLSPNPKFFVLYNKDTAVLRAFMLFSIGDYPGVDRIVTKAFVSTGREEDILKTHGLFNNTGARNYSMEEAAGFADNAVVGINVPLALGWIVTDYALAYDPMGYSGTPEYFNIQVYAENTQQIVLNGYLSGGSQGTSLSGTSLATTAYTAYKATPSVGATAGNVKSAGDKIKDVGTWMTAHGGDGASLVSIGTAVAAQQYWIAAAIVATQLIRTFMALRKKSGSASYSHHETSVRLQGVILDSGFKSSLALLLHNYRQADPFDIPYLFKANPRQRLGLFNLSRRPVVSIRLVTGMPTIGGEESHWPYKLTYELERGVRNLVQLNPSIADLSIGEISCQVVYRKKWNGDERGGHILLGSGMCREVDVADLNYVNIYSLDMEDPALSSEQYLVESGLGFTSTGPKRGDSVLVRIRMSLLQGNEKIAEVVNCYEANVNWSSAQDNALTTSNPLPEAPKHSDYYHGTFSGLRVGSYASSQMNSQTSDGWRRLLVDLNEGTDGQHLYLELFPGSSNLISAVHVQHGKQKSQPAPAGDVQVQPELNAGAGGEYIYVSYRTDGVGLSGLAVISGATSAVRAQGDFTKIEVDLNRGAGGSYIYLCFR